MLRAVAVRRAGDGPASEPFDVAVLAQDERHLRRRAITLKGGAKVLADFPEPVVLGDGDQLVLEDGRHIGIVAAEEELYDIRGRDALHLAELAWHIGNRHQAARIEASRILVPRDRVLRAMLEGLGARLEDAVGPFEPLGGAYSAAGDRHAAGHSHRHRGEPDR